MKAGPVLMALLVIAGMLLLEVNPPANARIDPFSSLESHNVYLPMALANSPLPRIAFYANWMGDKNVLIMDAEGKNWQYLTQDLADDFHPTFSPDGSKIAFQSDRVLAGRRSTNQPDGTTAYNVFIMNADGSNVNQLTNSGCGESTPDWSPDGSKIAYVSCDTGTNQIYTINVDGSENTCLSNNNYFDSAPAWSPDGSRIAYVSFRDDNADIYIMNADGSNQQRLTITDSSDEWEPDWSPDGTRLVFDSFRNGNSDLFLINANGTGESHLTQTEWTEFFPAWSTDGQWIAFCGVVNPGVMKIEKIKIDGTSRKELTSVIWGLACEPAWGH